MNQPLDFSGVGRAKPAPQAPNKPGGERKRPPGGRRSAPEKRTRLIAAAVAVAVVGGGAVYFTRSSDDSVAAAKLAEPRYCLLATQLTGQLLAAGVPAEGPVPESVGPDAIKPVLTRMGADLDELEDSAPSEVSDDVKTVVAAVRQAGDGEVSQIKTAGFLRAERAMVAFLATPSCGGAGGPAAGEAGS